MMTAEIIKVKISETGMEYSTPSKPKNTDAAIPSGKTAGVAQVSAQWRIAIKCGGKISGTAEPFWAPCNIHATALTLFFPCDSMKMHTVA